MRWSFYWNVPHCHHYNLMHCDHNKHLVSILVTSLDFFVSTRYIMCLVYHFSLPVSSSLKNSTYLCVVHMYVCAVKLPNEHQNRHRCCQCHHSFFPHSQIHKIFQGLVLAGLGDLSRSADTLSVPQSLSLAATGTIWCRYSLVVIPKNYSLCAVNVFVALTSLYQISRAIRYQQSQKKESQW